MIKSRLALANPSHRSMRLSAPRSPLLPSIHLRCRTRQDWHNPFRRVPGDLSIHILSRQRLLQCFEMSSLEDTRPHLPRLKQTRQIHHTRPPVVPIHGSQSRTTLDILGLRGLTPLRVFDLLRSPTRPLVAITNHLRLGPNLSLRDSATALPSLNITSLHQPVSPRRLHPMSPTSSLQGPRQKIRGLPTPNPETIRRTVTQSRDILMCLMLRWAWERYDLHLPPPPRRCY